MPSHPPKTQRGQQHKRVRQKGNKSSLPKTMPRDESISAERRSRFGAGDDLRLAWCAVSACSGDLLVVDLHEIVGQIFLGLEVFLVVLVGGQAFADVAIDQADIEQNFIRQVHLSDLANVDEPEARSRGAGHLSILQPA